MTSPQPQEETATLETVLALLVVLLTTGALLAAVISALGRLAGTTAEAIRFLFQQSADNPMADAWRWSPPQTGSWAEPQFRQYNQNTHRRAAYLVAAAGRMSRAYQEGGWEGLRAARVREARYWGQHLEAQRIRMRAASEVADQMNRVSSVLLGWHAKMDERTSGECRAANGRNFDPSQIPPIGYPGSVHPHCRCRAGVPFATRLRVETIRPDHEAWRVA